MPESVAAYREAVVAFDASVSAASVQVWVPLWLIVGVLGPFRSPIGLPGRDAVGVQTVYPSPPTEGVVGAEFRRAGWVQGVGKLGSREGRAGAGGGGGRRLDIDTAR